MGWYWENVKNFLFGCHPHHIFYRKGSVSSNWLRADMLSQEGSVSLLSSCKPQGCQGSLCCCKQLPMTLRTTAPCCWTKTSRVNTVLRSLHAGKRLAWIVWRKIFFFGASSPWTGKLSSSSATSARCEDWMRCCREPCLLGPMHIGSALDRRQASARSSLSRQPNFWEHNQHDFSLS